MSGMDRPEILHIHGPAFWHCDCQIIGTRGAMESLRNAINEALEQPRDIAFTAFCADGEGFDVIVRVRHEEEMALAELPYHDECARDGRFSATDSQS